MVQVRAHLRKIDKKVRRIPGYSNVRVIREYKNTYLVQFPNGIRERVKKQKPCVVCGSTKDCYPDDVVGGKQYCDKHYKQGKEKCYNCGATFKSVPRNMSSLCPKCLKKEREYEDKF